MTGLAALWASLGFDAPALLFALLFLPLLWWLLRALPPAPRRFRFPAVTLLLGLRDTQVEAARTPWWLLLLRLMALALLILGFAGPVLRPGAESLPPGPPLLLVLDGGWAESPDWAARQTRAAALLTEAAAAGRPTALLRLSDTPAPLPPFAAPQETLAALRALKPAPYLPGALGEWATRLPEGRFDTLWLSDGLDHPGRAALAAALMNHGTLRVIEGDAPLYALRPPRFDEGKLRLTAWRLRPGGVEDFPLRAFGRDPSGTERLLAETPLRFDAGAPSAEAAFDLPNELRARLTRFELAAGPRHAGLVALSDDRLSQRKIALVTEGAETEGLRLLSPLHYLRQAFTPGAEVIEGELAPLLQAAPDVLVLADAPRLSPEDEDAVLEWAEKGGLVLRFAGPRLAAEAGLFSGPPDPLLPLRLRAGGRSLAGAMSWESPKRLAPFAGDGPFAGLTLPPDVTVSAQVLAEPGPDVAGQTLAALEDGTPLVTEKRLGQGRVVLFHIPANAEWSNLPLSGLFVDMLARLALLPGGEGGALAEGALAGQRFRLSAALDAEGRLAAVESPASAAVPGEVLAEAEPGPNLPPGLYDSEKLRRALSPFGPKAELRPATWPPGVARAPLSAPPPQDLKGAALAAALALFLLDLLLALLWVGRLKSAPRVAAPLTLLALALTLAAAPGPARAQAGPAPGAEADAFATHATESLRFAFVKTGDPKVDEISEAGLLGLSLRLWERTTVEPYEPVAIDLEEDELAFFPFLYWPVTVDQRAPSPAAYAKLNQFLHSGGMIFFDTRDGSGAMGGAGAPGPETARLQSLAAPLDIPPLEPVPQDHVLGRSFYLLQEFPGRVADAPLWVEAAPPDAGAAQDGAPFRALNDGVSPVVIGSADYAAAWAVLRDGRPMLPLGLGEAGERQREMAVRFGINLIMYVLTGNYKSDQVHVPALLDRLGP